MLRSRNGYSCSPDPLSSPHQKVANEPPTRGQRSARFIADTFPLSQSKSALGIFDRGSGLCRAAHFRFAPLATVGPKNATCR